MGVSAVQFCGTRPGMWVCIRHRKQKTAFFQNRLRGRGETNAASENTKPRPSYRTQESAAESQPQLRSKSGNKKRLSTTDYECAVVTLDSAARCCVSSQSKCVAVGEVCVVPHTKFGVFKRAIYCFLTWMPRRSHKSHNNTNQRTVGAAASSWATK